MGDEARKQYIHGDMLPILQEAGVPKLTALISNETIISVPLRLFKKSLFKKKKKGQIQERKKLYLKMTQLFTNYFCDGSLFLTRKQN